MRVVARTSVILCLLAACTRSSEDQAPDAGLPPVTIEASPRYDEVFQIATHNAYWVDKMVPNDSFAGGVGERLLDQLLFDRARSIELDVHKDGRVYHTVPGNGLCATLRECLAQVRTFHAAVPRHDPITIVLELKELFEPNFDEQHRPEALDALVREELGALLFTPRDFLARCPGDDVLSSCARRALWPSIATLRGRVLVALLGNWDELGKAQATKDWAVYAASAPTRAAFPMASPWKLDVTTFTPRLQELVTQAELDGAMRQTIFLQIQDLADPRIDPFLAAHGVIRVDNAFSVDEQKARIARGMQLLQTDTPWTRLDDPGPAFSLGTLGKVDIEKEHGLRYLLAGNGAEPAFAYFEGAGASTLSTVVSSGGRALAAGCLRAESDTASVTWCRGKRESEIAVVSLEACDARGCQREESVSVEPEPGGIGDLLELGLEPRGDDTCARVRSARDVDAALVPRWISVGVEHCVTGALPRRGIYRPAAGSPILFTWTLRDGVPMRLSPTTSSALVDASGP